MRFYNLTFYVALAMMLLVSPAVVGQMNTKVNLSNPYAKRITEVKDAYKQTKEYRKQLKDSLKAVKKLDKIYKQKIDSLVKDTQQRSSEITGIHIPTIDSSFINDSTNFYKSQWLSIKEQYDPDNADSLALAQYERYVDSLNKDFNYQQYLIDSSAVKARLDSIRDASYLKNQAKALAEEQGRKFEHSLASKAGANALPSQNAPNLDNNPMTNQVSNTVPNMPNKKNLKQIMQKSMSGHLGKYNNAISEAHTSMANLKKKYSTIPSLGDLSTATKRNSLEGVPFKKRLRFGGNFHLQQTNTIDLDFSPSLAYRLNRKAAAGMEAVYRSKFGGDREWSDAFSPSMYGGRVFFDMVLYKSFFGRVDVESLHKVENNTSTKDRSSFISGALAGLGRVFNVGENVNGRVSIQYDFLHEDGGPYKSPWVLRFGFDLKKLSKQRLGIGNLKIK